MDKVTKEQIDIICLKLNCSEEECIEKAISFYFRTLDTMDIKGFSKKSNKNNQV